MNSSVESDHARSRFLTIPALLVPASREDIASGILRRGSASSIRPPPGIIPAYNPALDTHEKKQRNNITPCNSFLDANCL
jgi:hypothetical protein